MRAPYPRYPNILLILFVILVISTSSLLAACNAAKPSGTSSTATTTATSSTANPDISPTPAESRPGGNIPAGQPSGPLRLFCTPRETLNPLQETSASFLAVSQLIFEGLFALSSNGNAKPVLAEPGSLNIASNGYSLTVRLAADRRFHDGSVVRAGDVAASFAALRTAGQASAYNSLTPDIASITADDDSQLTISLNKPQADIAAQLTFPVIPAAALAESAADPFALLPGTGPYRFSDYSPEKGISLQADDNNPVGKFAIVREIKVIELPDLHAALTEFERDGIDLAGLPAEIYPSFALRSGLKLERYATHQYVFFSFRTQAGAPLADTSRLRFVQAVSRDPKILEDAEQLGLQTAAVPVHPDSSLWKSTAGNSQSFIGLYQPGRLAQPDNSLTYPTTRAPLVILVQAGDELLEVLAARLQTLLSEHGARAEVRLLAATDYEAARIAGQYDILIAQATLGTAADPRWLLGQNPDSGMPGSELLPRNGLEGYTAISTEIDRLFAAGTEIAAENPALLSLLTEAIELAPFTGVGFRYAALASGSRVLGQPAPQTNKLYEGIEELWLWST